MQINTSIDVVDRDTLKRPIDVYEQKITRGGRGGSDDISVLSSATATAPVLASFTKLSLPRYYNRPEIRVRAHARGLCQAYTDLYDSTSTDDALHRGATSSEQVVQ